MTNKEIEKVKKKRGAGNPPAKIKLTKKNRKIALKILAGMQVSVGEKMIRPFENYKEYQITHILLQKNGITPEQIENFIEI